MNKFRFLTTFIALSAPILMSCADNTDTDVSPEIIGPISQVDSTRRDVVIYQANPKLYAKATTFTSLTQRLPQIEKLGANVLYLMPIYPEGQTNAVGSPYCISDYCGINPNYGTADELKQLIATAHSAGMRVIFDWVGNHTSWDNEWITLHDDWYTHDASGKIIAPAGTGWNDVADLNYDNADMRKAMIEAMLYWVETFGIDGYRCDYADGVPTDFWKSAIEALQQAHPNNLLMLAESDDVTMCSVGFDMVYSWKSTAKLQALYAGNATIDEFYATSASELKAANTARFITNHDQASEKCPLNYYNGQDGALSAFVLTTMLGGSPFIYSSQEVGYSSNLSFFNQWAFDWDSNPSYTAEYCNYMAAYNATASLRSGTLQTYSTYSVASFYYDCGANGLLVIVNPTATEQQIKTPIAHVGMHFVNVVDGTEIDLPSALTLQPYQYLIFKK